MNENEFLLNDRVAKIQSIINEYDENNFYIAFFRVVKIVRYFRG